jgi:cytochrome c553
MTKKIFAIVLAILLMATLAAAQSSAVSQNLSKDSATGAGGLDPFGHRGHQNRGCALCHTPHSTAAMVSASAPVTAASVNSNVTYKSLDPLIPGNTTPGTTAINAIDPKTNLPFTLYGGVNPTFASNATASAAINLAIRGQQLGGNIYLWANPIGSVSYTTWDGGTLSGTAASLTKNDPEVHSLMCLSCHDTSNNSHDWANYPVPTSPTFDLAGTTLVYAGGSEKPNDWGGVTADGKGYEAGEVGGIGRTTYSGSSWNSGSLMNSHPVHAVYPGTGNPSAAYYWNISVDANQNVTFNDGNFALDPANANAKGHAVKLWAKGGVAYVECTSCHEPHRLTSYAYKVGANWVVGGSNSTSYYIRGAWTNDGQSTEGTGRTTVDGRANAAFCRSCHFSKTQEYITNLGTQP